MEHPPTVRDCLRTALRRSGCEIPPRPEVIAAPLTDDELAGLINGLTGLLLDRIELKPTWRRGFSA